MSALSAWPLFVVAISVGGSYEEPTALFKSGSIEVHQSHESYRRKHKHNYLLLGGIHRGLNFLKPDDPRLSGHREMDLSRLATCYHHRRSPIGVIMEKFNWLPGPRNTYWADAKTPASLVGLGAAPCSFGVLPAEQLAGLWSEPPYATVGMYVGTMASYARPFQTVHFYEVNPNILKVSLPKKGKPYFKFASDAIERGAEFKVLQGKEWRELVRKGPERFYHVIVVEGAPHERLEDVLVPLMTKEGMSLLFEKLTERGVLCYHISNRFINLVPVLTNVAHSLGFEVLLGNDQAPPDKESRRTYSPEHFVSEWVVVARKKEYLAHLKPPPDYEKRLQAAIQSNNTDSYPYRLFADEPYWKDSKATGKHVWTDESKHHLRGLMKFDPAVARCQQQFSDFLIEHLGSEMLYRFSRSGFNLHHNVLWENLHKLIIRMRESDDQTIEDLQKLYAKEKVQQQSRKY